MSLFFDQDWFNARLEALSLPRSALAAAAGLDETDIDLIWKDQREVRISEVAAFALLLATPEGEIARRCGISTRAPARQDDRIAQLEARVSELERQLARLSRPHPAPGAPAPDAPSEPD